MKYLLIFVFNFYIFSGARATEINCSAIANEMDVSAEITVRLVTACLSNPPDFDPNESLKKFRCEPSEKVEKFKSCSVGNKTIKSCDKEDKRSLCFNGVAIRKHVANTLMIDYLCSPDIQFFAPPEKAVTFGTCSLGDQAKVRGKMSCYCQHQFKNNKKPLAWHCYDTSK